MVQMLALGEAERGAPLWDIFPPREDTRGKERQRQTRLAQTVRISFAGTLPRRQALAPTPGLRSRAVKRPAALGAESFHASDYNFPDNSPPVDTPLLLPLPLRSTRRPLRIKEIRLRDNLSKYGVPYAVPAIRECPMTAATPPSRAAAFVT